MQHNFGPDQSSQKQRQRHAAVGDAYVEILQTWKRAHDRQTIVRNGAYADPCALDAPLSQCGNEVGGSR
jgi:hypothetical protein